MVPFTENPTFEYPFTGERAGSGALLPSLSRDGLYVTFESTATNPIADDTDGYKDLFVRGPPRRIDGLAGIGPGPPPRSGASPGETTIP